MFIGRRKTSFKGSNPLADSLVISITATATVPTTTVSTCMGVAVFLHGPLALASQLLMLLVDISLFNPVDGVIILRRDDLCGINTFTTSINVRLLLLKDRSFEIRKFNRSRNVQFGSAKFSGVCEYY